MGGRGSSNPSSGGGGGKVSVSSATKALKQNVSAFADGNPPQSITINGVQLTGGLETTYTSGGGYIVNTYKYVADRQIASDGSNAVKFNATAYKSQNGGIAKGNERRKPKVFSVEIGSGRSYSFGSSGGIGRTSGYR